MSKLNLLICLFFFWLYWVLVAAHRSFVEAGELSCGIRGLVLQPQMEPGPPAVWAQSLSHWTTREVPVCLPYDSLITKPARELRKGHFCPYRSKTFRHSA